MSDLEEVSDSELIEKMDDDEPTFQMKFSKKKNPYIKNYDDDEDEDEDEDYKSENDSDDDNQHVLGSIKLGGGDDDDEDIGDGNDGESDVDSEIEGDEASEKYIESSITSSASSNKGKELPIPLFESDEEDDDEEEDETYLQKFDKDIREDFITSFHPESKSHNYEEIKALARITRNSSGIIYDELHKTLPFLTKYEMTRVLGQRARQINAGGKSFVVVPPNIMDGYLIAKMELEQKKLPFIIKRPIPNGGFEYWNVSDLEVL